LSVETKQDMMVVFNYQWRSQPKICILRGKNFGGPKCLILGEQQYFVWDTASQSTKLLYVLNIWGVWPLGPPGYAYGLDVLTFEGAWHLALATPMLHMSLKTNGHLLSLAFLQLDYATHDQIAHGY